jgi:hypothetical protein
MSSSVPSSSSSASVVPSSSFNLFDWTHLKREFIAGGLAGSIGIFIGFPLDLIKVNLQVYPDRYKNARDCFVQMMKAEGVSGLYRGCLPPIISQGKSLYLSIYLSIYLSLRHLIASLFSLLGLINSLLFVGESTTMRFLEPQLKRGETGRPLNIIIAGCSGGLLQCVALVPTDVIKCTMQAEETTAANIASHQNSNAFKQTFQCMQKIYRQEGIGGFYKGFTATALREVPSIGMYFYSYKFIRDSLTKYQGLSEPSTFAILFAGGFAGALSWTVVYPFDVIKTNIQIAEAGSKTSFGHIAKELYRKHGSSVFFRGLGATVFRAFPVNGATFFFYERIKDFLHLE